MIKKIPIKGISRDPSGEISSDGFCAESLNVQLDMGEVAPAIKPRPVKDAGGNELSVDGDILYIHKGVGYENLIYRQGRSLLYVATIGDASSGLVYDGLADAEITGITAIGNTVIVSTAEDMYYILWREGAYRFLGNKIPIPNIHFRMGNLSSLRSVPVLEIADSPVVDRENAISRDDDDMTIFPHESIGDVTSYGSPAKKYVFGNDFQKGFWSDFLELTWGEIDKQIAECSRNGKAVFPMFLRYAVRLYDGTHYAQSIPILLGADIDKFVDAKGVVMQQLAVTSGEKEEHSITYAGAFVKLADPYSIVMNAFSRDLFDGWEDIVTAVEVFVSPQLKPVQRNAARFTMEYAWTESLPGVISFLSNGYKVENFVIDPYYTEENQEKLMLNYQNTYLARSFTIDEFMALPEDCVLDIDTSSDYIMAQEALKETSQSMHHTVGEGMFNYNKRLLLAGAEQSLYHGYPFLHSVKWDDMEQNPIRFVYYIRGENGEARVICRDVDGNKQITPASAAVLENLPLVYHEVPVAWLAYPDSRCYRIDVYFLLPGGQVRYKSFPTKAMDQADVAYAFVGFGVDITAAETAVLPDTENATIEMPNSLVVSKANNPFVFPATDVVTFTAGKVINIAVASVPLSEGQAGQFPLYVFTDEGVFAMTVDAEGKLRTSHNVSRDLLLSKDALIGIEQGVFFAAARGVLLLQGSRVTKVSSQMEGKPEIMDEEMLGNATGLLGFSVDESRPFRPFLRGCFFAYDYANTRIIIANPKYDAMYAYKFDTQSWHRLQTGFGKPVRALNSFPEAQLVMRYAETQAVIDFSVIAESEDAVPMKGLVYTRDLALDGADIYKTISRLEVRGRFKHGHVKWQLQGSNDGQNYTVIHSLRGPSWKWFRIVLVTMLDKDERISYVELGYSPKFTDKIR